MKFYIDYNSIYYWNKIHNNKLSCTYIDCYCYIWFFKNGELHNTKNAAYIGYTCKSFYLNGKYYVNQYNFTKQSWRRFVKLQAFL